MRESGTGFVSDRAANGKRGEAGLEGGQRGDEVRRGQTGSDGRRGRTGSDGGRRRTASAGFGGNKTGIVSRLRSPSEDSLVGEPY